MRRLARFANLHTMSQSVPSASSWSAVYNPSTQTMSITFPGGQIYDFDGVPPDIAQKFQEADSKGSFYNTYIRGRY